MTASTWANTGFRLDHLLPLRSTMRFVRVRSEPTRQPAGPEYAACAIFLRWFTASRCVVADGRQHGHNCSWPLPNGDGRKYSRRNVPLGASA